MNTPQKTRVASIIFIFSVLHMLAAQEVKRVELDFAAKKLEPIPDLKIGDFYTLTVKNINLNLYKVSFTKEDSTISSSVKFPKIEPFDLDLAGIITLLSKLTPISTEGSISQSQTRESVKYKHMEEFHEYPGKLSKADAERVKAFISELNSIQQKIIGIVTNLRQLHSRAGQLFLDCEMKRLYYISDRNIPALGEIGRYNMSLSCIINEIYQIRIEIPKIIDSIAQQRIQLNNLYIKYAKEIEPDSNLKGIYNIVLNSLAECDSFTFKMSNLLSSNSASELLKPIIMLINNSSDSYTSLPQQFRGDVAELKVRIEPKDSQFGLPGYYTSFLIPKLRDVYIGSGISFYNAFGFSNEVYSLQAFSNGQSDTAYKIVSEETSRSEIGICALLQYGTKLRPGSNLWGHLSIGPGISISTTVKPRLTLGGGISLGTRQMFSLDALVISGFSEVKSKVYDPSVSYKAKPNQITVSKLQYGFAIALGYIYNF